MKKTLFIFSILLLFIFGNSLFLEKNAVGAIIDFENGLSLGGDQTPIFDQYAPVLFYLDNERLPNLEEVNRGDPPWDSFPGFANDAKGLADIEADGLDSMNRPFVGQLGDYYLRLRATLPYISPPVPSLVIEFETPVYSASGQIWDIDAIDTIPGFEKWRVNLFDLNFVFLDSMDSPEGLMGPDSLDGKPWPFSFAREEGDIGYIRIDWIGTKESGIGIAFDNFEYTAVPIPGAIWLFGSGILGMVFMRRRFKN